jgi:anti-anti-sigma factor
MNVGTQTTDELTVVTPSGRIDALTASTLQDAVDQVIRDGALRVIIDMADVPFASSAGLRVFILAAKQLLGKGHLVVCGLNPNVKSVFAMAGFESLMSICNDLETARDDVMRPL